jgi:competence protein ComEC
MFGIGAGAAFLAGITLGSAGVALVVIVAILMAAPRLVHPAAGILIVLLSMVGWWRGPESPPLLLGSEIAGERTLVGQVVSYPVSSAQGQRFVFRAEEPEELAALYCVATGGARQVARGEQARVTGELLPLADQQSRQRSAQHAQGCQASLEDASVVLMAQPDAVQQVVNRIRLSLEQFFQRAAPGDAGALMTGLVTGDDTALSFEMRQSFLDTGTTHITAVSGANFAVLAMMVAALGGAGMRRRMRWILAVSVLIWAYALVTGIPPSAVRAAIMATLGFLALRFGRRPDFLTLLFLSAVIQLSIRPDDLRTLSFQLSFASTLALVLVFSGWQHAQGLRLVPAVVVSAAAAWLATTPVLAWRLGELTAGSIPANAVIAIPVMIAFPLVAVAGIAGLIAPQVAPVIAVPAAFAARLMIAAVDSLDRLLPGRIVTGALPPVAASALLLLCWIVILPMSHDVRILLQHVADRTGAMERIASTDSEAQRQRS